MLTREQILAANDRPTKKADIPGWGEVGFVALSVSQRERIMERVQADGKYDVKGVHALLVVFSAVGADGKPLFTEADAPALSQKSGASVMAAAEVVMKLSGLTAPELEELGKN